MLSPVLIDLVYAIFPTLIVACFALLARSGVVRAPNAVMIAHGALLLLLLSLALPALKTGGQVHDGWEAFVMSFGLVVVPPCLLSAAANILFVLAYIMFLHNSDRVYYLARFSPLIASAATTLSLFAGMKGIVAFDLSYQPENRIYIGAGTWICSHVLLALAYGKLRPEEARRPRLKLLSFGWVTLIGLFFGLSVILWMWEEEEPRWQRVNCVAFSQNERLLYSCITNFEGSIYKLEVGHAVYVWDLQTKEVTLRFSLQGKHPTCYEISPMGDLFAYGITEEFQGPNQRAKVMIVSTRNGEIQATLEGHTDEILKTAFSRDGSMIATASRDKTARLWRVSDGKELARFDAQYDVLSVAVANDGSKFAYSYHTTVPSPTGFLVYVNDWRIASEKIMLLNSVSSSSLELAFSPDSKKLACVSWQGDITAWNLSDISHPVSIPTQVSRASSLQFSPSGDILAYGSYTKVAVIVDCSQGNLTKVLQHPTEVNSVMFSPDGKRLVTAEGGFYDFEGAQAIRFWNVATAELESSLQLPHNP